MSTFLKISHDFLEFFIFLHSVLRVSPETDPRRHERCVSVLAVSVAEAVILNHANWQDSHSKDPVWLDSNYFFFKTDREGWPN